MMKNFPLLVDLIASFLVSFLTFFKSCACIMDKVSLIDLTPYNKGPESDT